MEISVAQASTELPCTTIVGAVANEELCVIWGSRVVTNVKEQGLSVQDMESRNHYNGSRWDRSKVEKRRSRLEYLWRPKK